MAVVSLFRGSNMAAVTSGENQELLEKGRKLLPAICCQRLVVWLVLVADITHALIG